MKSPENCTLPLLQKKSYKPIASVVDKESEPGTSLKRIADLVTTGECPYEDVAEQIEDRAYELCETGNLDVAVYELSRITFYFESLTDKNDEQCRDLADVYLLIGQIYQFAGCFIESIQWFIRSAIVDDRFASPYHSMGTSYSQLRQIDNAIKCFEQEIMLAPGNYYSYLLLADLYEREHRPDDVENCLKRLLERDPENIQGLHSLIRYYERRDTTIDTKLLIRRLMGITKQLSRIEIVIRAFYLCRDKKYDEVFHLIDSWSKSGDAITVIDLVKAHIYGEMQEFNKRQKIITAFKLQNLGRDDVIMHKLKEFRALFGDEAAENLSNLLLNPSSTTDNGTAE